MRFFDVNVLIAARVPRAVYFPDVGAQLGLPASSYLSERRYQIPAEMIHYCMTQAAPIAVARCLGPELTVQAVGVTVNSVFCRVRRAALACRALLYGNCRRLHGLPPLR